MEFNEQIQALADRVQQNSDFIENEEMTKNALILPFLQTLGYDPFNPKEVFAEYTADVGTKKGEKVDYAVMKDGAPIMLIECKTCNTDLDKCNASQLQRYFQTTPTARIGILTDGVKYQFFTDLDQQNIMDQRPYMIFNLKSLEDSLIPELKKLTKTRFDLETTLSAASELKYTRAIKKLFSEESQNPTDEFVRHFATQVYSGKLMASVKERFAEIVKRAFNMYVNEVINDRLKHAMYEEPVADDVVKETSDGSKPGIVTTDDEMEGYYIIKSILREVVDSERVVMRDTKSYCGILLDDNNRKPLCRLHFNSSQYYLGIIISPDKEEERVAINSLDDIFQHAERLRLTPSFYE